MMCVEDGAYQVIVCQSTRLMRTSLPNPVPRISGTLPSRPRISGIFLTTPRTLSISTFQLIICELSLHLSGVSSFRLQD